MRPGPKAVPWGMRGGECVPSLGKLEQTPCPAVVSFVIFNFSSSLANEMLMSIKGFKKQDTEYEKVEKGKWRGGIEGAHILTLLSVFTPQPTDPWELSAISYLLFQVQDWITWPTMYT